MSAILVYTHDWDYICPGFDSEHDAVHYLCDNEKGFKIVHEKWGNEEDAISEEIDVQVEYDDGVLKYVYKVEFLYLDEPTFIKEVT